MGTRCDGIVKELLDQKRNVPAGPRKEFFLPNRKEYTVNVDFEKPEHAGIYSRATEDPPVLSHLE